MPQLISKVRVGEVITAETYNTLVDAVNALLQSNQGNNGINIAAMVPAGTANEAIRSGTFLQIVGQHFGYSLGTTRVFFDSPQGNVVVNRAQMLAGSADDRLLFVVPAMNFLPQAGAAMTLRVNNGLTEDARSVWVLPVSLALQGDMFVTWRNDVTPNPKPNPIAPDAAAEFAFQLETGINMPATFDLKAEILDAPALSGLASSIVFLNADESAIANNRLEMGKQEKRNILARIPKLPVNSGGQSFKLRITAASGAVVGTETRVLTVNTPVEEHDKDIKPKETGRVVLDAAGNVDNTGGSLEGNLINLKPERQMVVSLNVELAVVGTFDLTFSHKVGTTLNNWSPEIVATGNPIVTTASNQIKPVQIGVTAAANSTLSGTVVLRIQRRGALLNQIKEYDVQLLLTN